MHCAFSMCKSELNNNTAEGEDIGVCYLLQGSCSTGKAVLQHYLKMICSWLNIYTYTVNIKENAKVIFKRYMDDQIMKIKNMKNLMIYQPPDKNEENKDK
jgi:hypothetical protein